MPKTKATRRKTSPKKATKIKDLAPSSASTRMIAGGRRRYVTVT
jgi:hypothetical protein